MKEVKVKRFSSTICFSGSKLFQYGNSSNELALDEEFPHDPNVIWKVRQGEDRFDLNKEEVSLIIGDHNCSRTTVAQWLSLCWHLIINISKDQTFDMNYRTK